MSSLSINGSPDNAVKKEYRLKGALCANALIVIMEVIVLVLSIAGQGLESFLFYTQDSNYFTMAVSLLFCVYAAKELRGKGKYDKSAHSYADLCAYYNHA